MRTLILLSLVLGFMVLTRLPTPKPKQSVEPSAALTAAQGSAAPGGPQAVEVSIWDQLPDFKLPDRSAFRLPEAMELVLNPPKPPPTPEELRPPLQWPDLTVQGIFWDTKPARAIINDQILSVGDTIQGVEITQISRGEIQAKLQYEESVLRVPGVGAKVGDQDNAEEKRDFRYNY